MDILVKRLQNENRTEKTKRLKYQKIAEDIQERESKIVDKLKRTYKYQMVKQIEDNRKKIESEYRF